MKRFLIFAVTVGGLLLSLKLLGWLPLAVDKGSVRGYSSIEDVKEELKPRKVFLPSYFPQYLKWPPSEIYAGRKPSFGLLMQFSHINTGEVVLAISQTSISRTSISQTSGDADLKSRIEPSQVIKEEDLLIKGRKAKLYLAVCTGGEPCNKVVWHEDGYKLTVTAKDSASEALKTAESMLSE